MTGVVPNVPPELKYLGLPPILSTLPSFNTHDFFGFDTSIISVTHSVFVLHIPVATMYFRYFFTSKEKKIKIEQSIQQWKRQN